MISGTSRDGFDSVLVNFCNGKMEILHALCAPYPIAIKQMLEKLLETGKPPGDDLTKLLDETLGRFIARTAQNLVREAGMEMRDITAIGSHGQNVWHQPGGVTPVSIQLGDPRLIAKGTGSTVVANFRSADVNRGGQGAPLAPLLHDKIFRDDKEDRAVLNVGGIANITMLPCNGGISGFDCGPANCLMDGWTRRHLQKDFDNDGAWASKGSVNAALLERLLSDSYFRLPVPKSTGLEHFNPDWLDSMLKGIDLEPVDVQATLAELTAQSIANSLLEAGGTRRLLVCGGGVQNSYLMRRIRSNLPEIIVESTARYGVDPNWVEGLLFAWLARERLNDRKQNTPPITGASEPLLLGSIY